MLLKPNPSSDAQDPIPSNLLKPLLQQFPLSVLRHQFISLYKVFPISLHVSISVFTDKNSLHPISLSIAHSSPSLNTP